MRSFLSNFTKMKRLELLNSGDNFRINLYKDESLPFNMINSVSKYFHFCLLIARMILLDHTPFLSN